MNFNILIAEDEDVIREILVSMVEMIFLKDYKFLELQIFSVQNGQEALEIAKNTQLDIILTDIIMPVMNGFELIRHVRSFDMSVPILVLSALSSEEDVNKIISSGASNYTTKPLNGKLFVAQIKVLVDFYLRRQRKYNYDALNLFTKSVYKRKIEFIIDKEDDLVEFWEYLIETIDETYRIENALHFIYDLEIHMIKKRISNIIILEENSENFYFTLSETDKLEEHVVQDVFTKHILDESKYINNGFFISVSLSKLDNDTIEKNTIDGSQLLQLKDMLIDDIRYSIHEEVSPTEFLSELDPTYEDKIENFLDDLSLLSVSIFNLESSNIKDSIGCIKEIIKYFYQFNDIINTMGLFNVINRSFISLIGFLEGIDENLLGNNEKRILLSKMLQGLTEDLESWIYMIFIDKKAADIHYFDASFTENCLSIASTFLESDDDGNDDDLEFF